MHNKIIAQTTLALFSSRKGFDSLVKVDLPVAWQIEMLPNAFKIINNLILVALYVIQFFSTKTS